MTQCNYHASVVMFMDLPRARARERERERGRERERVCVCVCVWILGGVCTGLGWKSEEGRGGGSVVDVSLTAHNCRFSPPWNPHPCHVMSWYAGSIVRWSVRGRPSAERPAGTHPHTPMRRAPGEEGCGTMHGAKERGARTKQGPPRAGERTLRNTSPADRPRLSGNWWVSP